jgi:hypothetical protein
MFSVRPRVFENNESEEYEKSKSRPADCAAGRQTDPATDHALSLQHHDLRWFEAELKFMTFQSHKRRHSEYQIVAFTHQI